MKAPTLTLLMAALAFSAAGVRAADAGGQEGSGAKTEQCIPIMQIDHTKILDDQNVLFYMKNKKIYKNHLPNRCAGLKASDTFKYKTSQSQLCNVDIITVLNRTGGDFMPGPSCGLGLFEPYTPPPKEEKQATQAPYTPDPDED